MGMFEMEELRMKALLIASALLIGSLGAVPAGAMTMPDPVNPNPGIVHQVDYRCGPGRHMTRWGCRPNFRRPPPRRHWGHRPPPRHHGWRPYERHQHR
jgi:hypothetical protein